MSPRTPTAVNGDRVDVRGELIDAQEPDREQVEQRRQDGGDHVRSSARKRMTPLAMPWAAAKWSKACRW